MIDPGYAEVDERLSAAGYRPPPLRRTLRRHQTRNLMAWAATSVRTCLDGDGKTEIAPPAAEHVQAVHHLLPARYKVPLIALDATGIRLGELEGLRWDDVDERRLRWRSPRRPCGDRAWKVGGRCHPSCSRPSWGSWPARIARQSAGCSRGSAAPVPHGRHPRLTAAGVPAFSPHDLRHRRISLLHSAASRGHGSVSTWGSATSRDPKHLLARAYGRGRTRLRASGRTRVKLVRRVWKPSVAVSAESERPQPPVPRSAGGAARLAERLRTIPEFVGDGLEVGELAG